MNKSIGRAPPQGTYFPRWKYYNRISVSGGASIDFQNLPNHDMWLIMFELTCTDNTNLNFRINNDGGNNYDYREKDNVGLVAATGQTQIRATRVNPGAASIGQLFLNGKRKGTNNEITVSAQIAPWDHIATELQNGIYQASANVSRLTLYPAAGTITGTAELYYKDW